MPVGTFNSPVWVMKHCNSLFSFTLISIPLSTLNVVLAASTVAEPSLLRCAKAPSPISSTFAGILTVVSRVPAYAVLPIFFNVVGNTAAVNALVY